MLRKLSVILAALVLWTLPAHGQTAQVVSSCGSAGYVVGQPYATTQDTGGNQCVNGSGGTVVTVPKASATTIANGTITTGGTFQQIAASSTSRLSLEFQNNNSSDNCYLYFGTTGSATTAKSILVTPNAYYLRSSGSIPSDAVQVTCVNTSDTYYAAVQ